jgi:hypothetical protein
MTMDDANKAQFIDEFKKSDGPKRLDMWDFALSQQVMWESIIADIQVIARKQGVDKDLDKLIEEDMKQS